MSEPEIVTRKGKAVSVIIPIKDYEELLERLEDADDISWLKRARRKPLRYRPLEQYLAARPIAEPLHLFDCVMPCAGAEAFLVMSEERARSLKNPSMP